jgi:hypothetical protein
MINTFHLLASTFSDCLNACMASGQLSSADCANHCTPITNPGLVNNPVLGTLGNQTGVSFFQKFIPMAITLAFIIGALIFFFMLVIGAIAWISSGGDKQALEGARGKITNALIGIVILFAVFAVIRLIQNFFGISILNLTIPTITGT